MQQLEGFNHGQDQKGKLVIEFKNHKKLKEKTKKKKESVVFIKSQIVSHCDHKFD